MTLTNEDILKLGKLIKSTIRSEVGNETKSLKSSLTSEMKITRMRIQLSISSLEDKIKDIEINQTDDHKLLLSMKKDIKKLDILLNKTSDFLDKDNLNIFNKLNKTRAEIRLPELNFV